MRILKFFMNPALLAIMTVLASGCDFATAPKEEIHSDGKTMGTFYTITVVGDYPGGQKGLNRDAEEVLHRINKEISTFDKDSILSKFNNTSSTAPFRITQDMADVITTSIRVGAELNGAMDIRVLDLKKIRTRRIRYLPLTRFKRQRQT